MWSLYVEVTCIALQNILPELLRALVLIYSYLKHMSSHVIPPAFRFSTFFWISSNCNTQQFKVKNETSRKIENCEGVTFEVSNCIDVPGAVTYQ